ncbi:MAG TPA: DUF5674 family protein [Candidatus Binatia bacterium]|nr:DUF5674 family protein [Candidatus Binatia bacterium]
MKIVEHIRIRELTTMAKKMYGSLVKADVDIAKRVLIVDMGMHADGEAYLMENGSKQNDLWGINLHPADYGTDDFIEFDSLINIRPSQGNASKNVLDPEVKQQIVDIVKEIVHE